MNALEAAGLASDATGAQESFGYYHSGRGASWLLPPSISADAVNALYQPTTIGGRARRMLMRSGLLAGQVGLPSEGLNEWRTAIGRILGDIDLQFAVYIAGNEAIDKLTMAVFSAGGRHIAYVKIAPPAAHAAIRTEVRWLDKLAENSELTMRVPRRLGTVLVHDALALVTDAQKVQSGPTRFGDLHVDFLQRLRRPERTLPLAETALVRLARTTVQELNPQLPKVWRSRVGYALELLGASDHQVHVGPAHRDLTPWNTSIKSSNLYVYDWETARDDYPHGVDETHFSFVPSVLLGKKRNIRRVADLASINVKRGYTPVEVAYLMDLALHYLLSQSHAEVGSEGLILGATGEVLDHALGLP